MLQGLISLVISLLWKMFQDASKSLNWDNLNKDYCYSFVLAHPDNRVVARHNKPFFNSCVYPKYENI